MCFFKPISVLIGRDLNSFNVEVDFTHSKYTLLSWPFVTTLTNALGHGRHGIWPFHS